MDGYIDGWKCKNVCLCLFFILFYFFHVNLFTILYELGKFTLIFVILFCPLN